MSREATQIAYAMNEMIEADRAEEMFGVDVKDEFPWLVVLATPL